jgi:hypothetical protein
MVVERGVVSSVKGGCELVEEDDYTTVANYMASGTDVSGGDSDVKVIDFSAYAYRGY